MFCRSLACCIQAENILVGKLCLWVPPLLYGKYMALKIEKLIFRFHALNWEFFDFIREPATKRGGG